MSRILLLAYYFPPTGGAGTQRSVFFARELARQGHSPVVVTGRDPSSSVWSPSDETLSQYLPPEVEIVRTRGSAPPSTGRAASFSRRLSLPGPFARWWVEEATRAAVDVARTGPIDLIYASMSPYESGAIGKALSRHFGVPWIADLRDPWALDEMREYPTGIHRQRDLARMRTVLSSASAVIMNTAEAKRRLVGQFPELGVRRVTVIPNGWNAADFASPAPAVPERGFRIVHTGSLHTESGDDRSRVLRRALGGSAPIDVRARSHVHVVEAMRRVRTRRPDLASQLELHLAGALTEADKREVDRGVVVHGYLPHAASVALLRSADLLFLPMHDLPRGRRATIVPGKTYEYLAAGRPILGALPDGDARDLLSKGPEITLCRPGHVEAIVDALVKQAGDKRSSGAAATRHHPDLHRFERGRLSLQLCRLVEEVLELPPRTARPQLKLVV